MGKAIKSLSQIFGWLGMAVMAAMALLITISVIMRYVFKYPMPGDYEMIKLMMVVIIMLGLGYTQFVEGHISITLLVDRFPRKVKRWLDIFTLILAVGIMALIIWRGWVQGMYAIKSGESTDILHIPVQYFKFLVPIGFFIWMVEVILKIDRLLTERKAES